MRCAGAFCMALLARDRSNLPAAETLPPDLP